MMVVLDGMEGGFGNCNGSKQSEGRRRGKKREEEGRNITVSAAVLRPLFRYQRKLKRTEASGKNNEEAEREKRETGQRGRMKRK